MKRLDIYVANCMSAIKTRASVLPLGPLSGGYVIDQRLKIFVWNYFGTVLKYIV